MRYTSAILGSLLLIASASFAEAGVLFSTDTTPGAVASGRQAFTVRVNMVSDANVGNVTSYGFRVALSTIVGPLNSFTTLTGPGVTGDSQWALDFTHTDPGINGTLTSLDFIGGPGTGTNFLAATGPRFRDFSFSLTQASIPFPFLVTVSGLAATPTGFLNGAANVISNAGTSFAAGTVTAVPEPASLALLASVGGLALCARFRNRKSRKKLENSAA